MPFISNGTTILDNGAFSVGLGSQILISEATASGSSSIEFTSGIDSTYDIYQFELINIHGSINTSDLTFNLSSDGGSNYNVTKTTTVFRSFNYEDNSLALLQYYAANDLAQGTGYQTVSDAVGTGNDENLCATMQLFNPSSTTFVKHFIGRYQHTLRDSLASDEFYVAGYGNTTSAINAISFKFDSGNIDAGTIKMYGIKGS